MTITEDPPVAPPGDGTSGSGGGYRLTPPWDRRRIELTVTAVVFGVIALWAIRRTEIWDLGQIFGDGLQNILNFLFGTDVRNGALPPRFDELGEIIDQAIVTFFMAVAGTALAAAISFPLGFLAARNTTPHPVLRYIARGIIVFARTIPDIVFAFIFVRVYTIGPLPGILALGFHAIGMIGKLLADAIEETDPGEREAIASTGGGWFQQMSTGVLPQVMPSFLATVMFRLDINFRSSTVLGIVGAGGIGQLFNLYKGNLRWDLAMGVVVVIMITVLIVEAMSTAVRKSILGADAAREPSRFSKWIEAVTGRSRVTNADLAPASTPDVRDVSTTTGQAVDFDRERLVPPFDAYRQKMAFSALVAAVLVYASYLITQISIRDFFTGIRPQFGDPDPGQLPSVWNIGQRLIPSNLDWWTPLVRSAMFDTVAVGFAAAAIGIPLALAFAYLAARNVSPNRFVYAGTRLVLVLIRALPDLIIVIMLVTAMGLTLIPGVIGLIIGAVGFGGKVFAEAIEEVKEGPREGVFATGASRTQEAVTAVTPQFMPALVGLSLYILDILIRGSAVLGIVGAGGIGALISNFMQGGRYEEVGGILLFLFVVIFTIERISDWIRKRLI
ncbi:MAG: phosphonate ABC transporter, permease protein PhnE [Actinomycetota bacterium]